MLISPFPAPAPAQVKPSRPATQRTRAPASRQSKNTAQLYVLLGRARDLLERLSSYKALNNRTNLGRQAASIVQEIDELIRK